MLRRARAADSQFEIIEPLKIYLESLRDVPDLHILTEWPRDINAVLPSF
jgi:hypothetical protein